MFGPESKLFPKASKLGAGHGNSQFPGQGVGDIPNWRAKYQYVLNQEIMGTDNAYYRCTADHVATDNFGADFFGGLWELMASPLAATSVGYSNVLWVDGTLGNNGTALAGRFDKPYSTLSQALTIAASMSPTSTSRVLIHVRRGSYSGTHQLRNFVDVYCEAGVVFTSSASFSDTTAGPVTANVFGYAKFITSSGTGPCLRFERASTINFEFDSMSVAGSLVNVIPNSGSSNITINCNSMESLTTVGSGLGMTIRAGANLTLNVRNFIKCPHDIFDLRASFSGKFIVTCPKIILTSSNLFGGNFKSVVKITGAMVSGSRVEINGNLYNEAPTYLGGTSSMIHFGSSGTCEVFMNGDIYAGTTIGVWGNTSATSNLIMNGSIYSQIQAITATSAGRYLFKNGSYVLYSTLAVLFPTMRIANTCSVYVLNGVFYNQNTDGNIIELTNDTAFLNLNHVIADSEGAAGEFVTTALAQAQRFNNVRSRKAVNVLITDALVPSGLIIDANLLIPKF